MGLNLNNYLLLTRLYIVSSLYPLPPITELHRAARSAGGSHTMTRPHQRFRLAPYGGPPTLTSPEPYVNNMTSKSR